MGERRVTMRDLIAGVTLATGERHRLVLSVHDRVEIEDVFFNHNSALFLPDAPAPGHGRGGTVTDTPFSNTELWKALQASNAEFFESVQQSFDLESDATSPEERQAGVPVLLAALRFLERKPDRRLAVAGHTDTVDDGAHNEKLSERRAANVVALMEGDRTAFVETATANHTAEDDAVVLRYVARTRGWPCDVPRDQPRSADDIRAFQRSYNEAFGARGATQISVDGVIGSQTLGAYFDVMEEDLVVDAGGSQALASLRKKIAYADPKHKTLACGERYPIEGAGADNFKSLTNRRVELLFFDPFDLPDVKAPNAADRIYKGRLHPLRLVDLRAGAFSQPRAEEHERSFELVEASPPPEGVGETAEPLTTMMALRPDAREPDDAWAFLEPLDEIRTSVAQTGGPGPQRGPAIV